MITVFSPHCHSPIFYFFPNHGQVGPPSGVGSRGVTPAMWGRLLSCWRIYVLLRVTGIAWSPTGWSVGNKDGGLDWLPCLSGRDLADGQTLLFSFHGSLVADFRPDTASGFQFARGGYPTLAGSKCLGSGELRRPAGAEWLSLIVSPEVSGVFWVPTCPPEIRSHQYVVLQQSGPPPHPPLAAGGDSSSLPTCK